MLTQQAPKEQYPKNSQVSVLLHVSTLESGMAVPTDGENYKRRKRVTLGCDVANLSGSATEGDVTNCCNWWHSICVEIEG